MTLIKRPHSYRINSYRVCLTDEQVTLLKAGHYTKLVIMNPYYKDQVLRTKDITPAMVDSIRKKRHYSLMSYYNPFDPKDTYDPYHPIEFAHPLMKQ